PTLACQLTAARAVAAADPPLTGADLPPGAGQVAAADWATEKGQAPGAGQALGADWVAETDQAPGAGASSGRGQASGVTPGAGGDRATAQVSPAGVDPAGGAAPGSGGVEAAGMLRLGVQLGVAEAAVLGLAAVPLAAALHVGVPAMLWLAGGQLPLTL